MSKLIAAFVLLAACGSDPYSWGDTSQQVSQIFCHGLDYCGELLPEDVDTCIEHTAWHLCEAEGTCGVELDQASTEALLTECDTAVGNLNDFGCYLLGFWNFMPAECSAVFDLQPEPEL